MKVTVFLILVIVALVASKTINPPVNPPRKDVPCTVCQTIVTGLHALIRQNVSQEVLFKQTERLCPFVNPPEYRPKVCPRLMGPIIVQVGLSRREIQAKYFCQLLGVCPPVVAQIKLLK